MSFVDAFKFMREHPALLRLLQGFPKISGTTGKLLLKFVEKALASKDPDRFVREALVTILSREERTTVEVIHSRPLKR